MSTLLVVQGVTHHYGARASRARVLADVSLNLDAGRTLALVGRSGSGKSTLCHLIAGLSHPQQGTVQVDDREASTIDDWVRVSVCPQRIALAEEFTVAENVLLPCSVRQREPLPGLLETLGLSDLATRPSKETSLGEQQRTGVARALVTAPRLAVLDEPTGHQDDRNAQRVADAIDLARGHGTAVVIATHDERVLDGVDDIVRLVQGRLLTSPSTP